MEKAYSKQTWRTIRKRERANEKEGKRLGGLRALCRARACLFIFASGLRMRYTRWILSFSLPLSLSLVCVCARADSPLSQAAAGKEENAEEEVGEEEEEEEEAQDVKGVKETERRGDAGREIRKELSSVVVLG